MLRNIYWGGVLDRIDRLDRLDRLDKLDRLDRQDTYFSAMSPERDVAYFKARFAG